MSFVRSEDGGFELIPATGSVRELRGALTHARAAAAVALAEMKDAVAAGAGERPRT